LGLWITNRALDGLDGTRARAGTVGGYTDRPRLRVYAIVPMAMVIAAAELGTAMAGAFLLATFFVNAASWSTWRRSSNAATRGVEDGELTTVTMPPGIVAGTESCCTPPSLLGRTAGRGVVVMGAGVLTVQRLWWEAHLR
jgi:hypothetical protein